MNDAMFIRLTIAMLLLMSSSLTKNEVLAINWQTANGGQVQWAMDCDFNGYDIARQFGTADQCASLCIANGLCTHFTWYQNFCYMKRTTIVLTPTSLTTAVCGFLGSPLAINWQTSNGGQVQWAVDCDFYGYDIAHQSSTGDQCASLCIANGQCTHFTWNQNGCYMKRSTVALTPTSLPKAVCGFLVSQVGPTSSPPIGKLIWQEEFDTLNTNRWKYLITGWGGGNGEFQYYTNRPENSYVRNGNLYIKPTLTADRFGESFLYNGKLDLNKEGCNLNIDGGCIVQSGVDIVSPIQSARMVTEDSFSFTYGTIIVRAKMPKGDWIWPAIWMLPTGSTYGQWPRSGEIDIVESRGNNDLTCGNAPNGRQLAGTTLHWGPDTNLNQWSQTHWEKVNRSPDFSSDFHLYRVEWKSTGFQFYIDDQKIGEVSPPVGGFWQKGGFGGNNIWASGSKMAPFDKPFHFVLNVAVGGGYFPDGCTNNPCNKPWSASDTSPKRKFWEKKNDWLPTWNLNSDDAAMQIDYIRVYAP